MKKILAIALAVVLSIVIAVPSLAAFDSGWLYELLDFGSGTTYYIDSVSGNDSNSGKSEDDAWKTLDKVNSTVFSAGDKILFKSGCTFIGQLMPKGSGNAEDGAIIISRYGSGAQPVIDANGTLENEGAVIRLYNQEYIEISDLELTNNSSVPGVRYGVYVIAEDYGVADHIYVKNCNIHDVPSNARKENVIAMAGNGGEADYLSSQGSVNGGIVYASLCGGAEIPTAFNDILIDGNSVSKTGVTGTGISITSEWVMFVGYENSVMQEGYLDNKPFFGSTNILISNNNLKNTTNAIRFMGCDGRVGNGVIAEHNISYKPDNGDSNSAMWANYSYDVVWQYNEVYGLDNGGMNDCGAFDADGYSQNTIFQYNYTHDNRGEPIMFCNVGWNKELDYTNTTGSVWRYNISQNDMWGANEGHGRFWVQKGAKDNWFYNNVVYVGEGLKGRNISIADTWENYIFNNIFINLSDKTSYYIEVPDETIVQNNCFYGYHPASEPSQDKSNILMDLDDEMPLIDPGKGEIGLDTLQGYMLKADSELVGAGKIIENNGGKDFYGNIVSSDTAPDIGVHQTASSEDTEAPEKATGLKAENKSYDKITVSWNGANDNAGIERYVVYVNGKPLGRTSDTKWTATELTDNTEYSFFVRAFDAAGQSSDSEILTVKTERAENNDLKLHISQTGVYDMEGNKKSTFKAADFVAARFKVVNANGKPVENALVRVLISADSQSDYETFTDMTDKNGIAQIGFYADSYRGEKTEVVIKAVDISKENYTYDSGHSGNIDSVKLNVIGADTKYFANLVRNPEFSLVYEGTTTPMSWGVASSNGLDAVKVAEGVGIDSDNALEFSENETFTSLAIQNYTDLPNGVYTLTYYVKNTANSASVTLSGYGSSVTESIPISPKWQQVSVSDINVTTGKISLQFDVTGDATTITYLDKVELSQNLITNTLYTEVHPYSRLPQDYYYKTENGIIGEDGSNVEQMINDGSIKAVNVETHYTEKYNNALKIGSDEAFNVTIGQTLKNVAKGVYTLKVDAINTGDIKAFLVIKEHGGKEISQEIKMSSGMKSTKISGVEVTSGKAVVELRFEGTGDKNEYVILKGLSFSARSDYPVNAAAITFAGDNLLASQNPSFENDGRTTKSLPTSWVNTWDQGKVSCFATNETAHTGDYSCKIILHHDQQLNNDSGSKTTSLNLKPNSHTFTGLATGYYTFSLWAKGNLDVKVGATANGNKNYEKYSSKIDEWHKVEIKNILVTNGQLGISIYNAKYENHEFIEYYAYIDDVELYLQEEYLSNEDFESGVSTGWQVTENKGYGEVKSTSTSFSGSKAVRIVLPGTPSTVSFATTAVLKNMQAGTYSFSAYVKGTSVVEMYIRADGKEEVVSRAVSGDDWQQVILDATISDSVQEMGVRLVNPDKTTSSYVTVDKASFQRRVTASDIATTIGDLKPIPAGTKVLTLPSVRDGFSIKLEKTSDASVISLDGKVTTPAKDTVVNLTFKIINNSDPTDIVYVISSVKVLAYETEEEIKEETPEIEEDDEEVSDENEPTDESDDKDVIVPPSTDDKPSSGKPIEQIIRKVIKTQFSWLVFIMFLLAIISVIGFTFVVMLAMKKKAQEKYRIPIK